MAKTRKGPVGAGAGGSWKGTLIYCFVGVQTGATPLEGSVEVPQIARIIRSLLLASPLCNTYPKDSTSYYRDTSSPMCIVILGTVARKGKQARRLQ